MEMGDFLTLKMLPPLALASSKIQISHVKWVFSDQWVKKIAFFCARANGNIFRVKR